MKILVTRPLEDGRQIAARLAEMGHQALLAPLLEPRFFDGPEPALDDVQAILATSANGVRALIRRTPRRDIPIFAVGPQTAEEATKAGFTEVRSADGDAVRWRKPQPAGQDPKASCCMSAAKMRPVRWRTHSLSAVSRCAVRCSTAWRRPVNCRWRCAPRLMSSTP